MLDKNDANEVSDGGTLDGEGKGYECIVAFQEGMNLAGNVGDMSATCWRHCEMSPIFVPTGQIWRHGF